MSIEQMREKLKKLPYGPSWIAKVEAMREGQIRAVYYRALESGKFNKEEVSN